MSPGAQTVEQQQTVPTDAGDHERFSHYVPKDKLTEAMVMGTPVVALCGKVWVPSRDPEKYPVCPECKEAWEQMKTTTTATARSDRCVGPAPARPARTHLGRTFVAAAHRDNLTRTSPSPMRHPRPAQRPPPGLPGPGRLGHRHQAARLAAGGASSSTSPRNPRDFLAVATPGAGKTTFALTVAAELLARRVVERVTVVAPTEHLKTQWAEAAARVGIPIDPPYSGKKGPHQQGLRRGRGDLRRRGDERRWPTASAPSGSRRW